METIITMAQHIYLQTVALRLADLSTPDLTEEDCVVMAEQARLAAQVFFNGKAE